MSVALLLAAIGVGIVIGLIGYSFYGITAVLITILLTVGLIFFKHKMLPYLMVVVIAVISVLTYKGAYYIMVTVNDWVSSLIN